MVRSIARGSLGVQLLCRRGQCRTAALPRSMDNSAASLLPLCEQMAGTRRLNGRSVFFGCAHAHFRQAQHRDRRISLAVLVLSIELSCSRRTKTQCEEPANVCARSLYGPRSGWVATPRGRSVTVAIVGEMEDLRTRKLVSAAVLGALLAMLTGATFAQTAQKGHQDCKAGEHWDQASKSCKK